MPINEISVAGAKTAKNQVINATLPNTILINLYGGVTTLKDVIAQNPPDKKTN
jgi:hypothetical protein